MTDMVEAPSALKKVAGVRFSRVGKLYHFDYSDYPDLELGDYVIVETARGRHMGQIMGFTLVEPRDQGYRTILRPATPRDLVLKQYWESKEAEALVICRELADKVGGFRDVKFLGTQYNYDGSVVTFLYSIEQKMDMGRLIYQLKRHFSAQVEMRQIGPRDVAKLLGGYGACGELRCCSTFLTDFSPISIKMAKMQGISLNPTEITGMCGRLRCCLVYEYEQYVEARKQLPKRNKKVGTPLGEGKVIDVHPLSDSVTVYIEEEGRRTFKREELIPLEELRALEQKAKEPCSKHGDEPCDCGQKPGTRNQDRIAKAEEDTIEADATTAPTEDRPRRPRSDRRDRRDKPSRKPGMGEPPVGDKPEQTEKAEKGGTGDKPKKRSGKPNRRGRRNNKGNRNKGGTSPQQTGTADNKE
ncbi:MAG: hypothetical protein OHK0046_03750 [Anaerolineae bacterium]